MKEENQEKPNDASIQAATWNRISRLWCKSANYSAPVC